MFSGERIIAAQKIIMPVTYATSIACLVGAAFTSPGLEKNSETPRADRLKAKIG